jgi:hypothetical protein
MEEHYRGHNQLEIIIGLLVRLALNEVFVKHYIDLLRSIYGKYRHKVIYVTFLGTMYDGLNGRRGPGPHLKAGHTNGRTGHGRRIR